MVKFTSPTPKIINCYLNPAIFQELTLFAHLFLIHKSYPNSHLLCQKSLLDVYIKTPLKICKNHAGRSRFLCKSSKFWGYRIMGSLERSKKKVHLWKKAIVHFLLCFVMGFFTGFAPTSKASIFSSHVTMSLSSSYSPQPVEAFHQANTQGFNRSLWVETEPTEEGHNHIAKKEIIPEEEKEETDELYVRRLVIVVTPTSVRNKVRGVLLRRLANTLKLVAQPLLWIVVEQQSDDSKVSEILRKTGIMYRHVVFKENFTDANSEMDHQRNIALNHIEHHRLSGIVHFAGLSNVYDLSFFEEIRAVEAFGTWSIAKLSANKKKVVIEGPVCDSSEVVGWHLKKMNNLTDATPPPLHVSSFAFNSSILWDPERWGRTSSGQDSSQNSLSFVRKEVLEEEAKLKGIPRQGCSKVLLWDLQISHQQYNNIIST